MFVEIHALQSFAPSNLNRDDTNNPKDCEFGGVRRARISSQCIKRAIRNAPAFAAATGVEPALRSKRLASRIKDILPQEMAATEAADGVVREVVESLFSKMDGKNPQQTAVLLYISDEEIKSIGNRIASEWVHLTGDAKQRKSVASKLASDLTRQFRNRTSAPDIALFGRMLAEKPELSLDAACQVAHALSTHRVTVEMDFYTAVDDLQPDDTAGAGMMGFTGYDSACYYRYARIDWEQLLKNLDQDAALAQRTVEGFLRATVEAMPTGKQNSFAAYNPPSLLVAVVRTGGMAWSLTNAFERPVRPSYDSGLVGPSIEALDRYWKQLSGTFGNSTIAAVAVASLVDDAPLSALAPHRVGSVDEWVAAVLAGMGQPEAIA